MEIGAESFYGIELYGDSNSRDEKAVSKALDSDVTGFVCGNDAVAVRVIKVLEEAGRRVPEEVSVTGFDAATPSEPGLRRVPTSIDPHFFEIGQVAAQMALQRIAQPLTKPCIISVRGDVVLGDSTAPLKNK